MLIFAGVVLVVAGLLFLFGRLPQFGPTPESLSRRANALTTTNINDRTNTKGMIGHYLKGPAIAGGFRRSVGLKGDGTVVCWGRKYDDQKEMSNPSSNADFIAVASGRFHCLGLKSDGTVVGWGSNWGGQCDVPSPNTNFIAVACGLAHSLGLKSDGSIVCWGSNCGGQCNVPSPNTNFISIAAGEGFSLGLKADGTIVFWGVNTYGQCNVPSPNSNFIAVAVGVCHSLGLKADGTVVCWGVSSSGECNVPAPNSDFIAVAGDMQSSIGLKKNGNVVCWGRQTNTPSPNTGFTAVASAWDHFLGLKEDGTIVCWGNNEYGQCTVPLPNREFGIYYGVSPDLVPSTGNTTVTISGQNLCDGTDVTNVTLCGIPVVSIVSQSATQVVVKASPARHSMNGDVVVYSRSCGATLRTNVFAYSGCEAFSLGTNGVVIKNGELASAANGTYFVTTQDETITRTFMITNPGLLTLNITGGAIKGTGEDRFMVDSLPATVPEGEGAGFAISFRAQTVGIYTAVLSVANSSTNTPLLLPLYGIRYAVSTNNGPATGANELLVTSGIMGNGWDVTNVSICGVNASIKTQTATSFVVVVGPGGTGTGDIEVRSVNHGSTTIRSAYTYNSKGSIGHSMKGPVLGGGEYHSIGLKGDGTVVCWGMNSDGQCHVPSPNTNFIAVAAGEYHSLGLKSDGTIVCWGKNEDGQCNVPTPNAEFIGVAGGGSYSLGLKKGGSVVCWGNNNYGQCDTPKLNTDFVMVSAMGDHSIGLKKDGTITCWGLNDYGQCDVPEPNADFVAVAVGAGHSAGLKTDGSIVCWGWNYDGQCDVPEPNTDFIALGCGRCCSIGLKADGTIVCWGSEHGVPAPSKEFIAINRATFEHTLAVRSDGAVVCWGWDNFGRCSVPAPNTDFGIYDGVSPVSGSVAGGTRVEIAGRSLCHDGDVTNVTLCGIPVAAIVSQTSTQIVVRAAQTSHPTNGDVVVYSTSYGVTTKSNGFSYVISGL
jgi:alpha-tubulin suppressor-like RCC1 family protein